MDRPRDGSTTVRRTDRFAAFSKYLGYSSSARHDGRRRLHPDHRPTKLTRVKD
ncbi:MAG: hypothetical protein AAGF12_26420 [Myxococcota bacterium]